MSDSCEKPQGIIYMLIMGEKENDELSLHCVAVFLAYDFTIADFPTPE